MKLLNTRFKKTIGIATLIIIAFVVLVIIFISPIAKYLIEKYDVKYLGREVTLDYSYVNPFTGYIKLNNVVIRELNSDTIFFSASNIYANFEVNKLFHKTYEISELELKDPKGYIIQNGDKHDLNFKDIIDRFSKKGNKPKKAPVHFSIDKIIIHNGEFHYFETVTPINYFIKKVDIESGGIYWDSDTIAATFSFLPGIGTGDLGGKFTINYKTLDYNLTALVNKFDLAFLDQYLKDISNYGTLRANLDANFTAKGNFKQAKALLAKGKLAINDFHFGKNQQEDFASFKKFEMNVIELDLEHKISTFDSVMLSYPYFKFEKYDHLDNIQNMFGKKGSKVKEANQNPEHFNLILEIAKYVQKLAKNFLRTNFKIKRAAIYNANVIYNDYSPNEKFSISLDPMIVTADSIFKSKDRVKIFLRSDVKPYGKAIVSLSINPKDSSDFDLTYSIGKLPVSLFNPYLISYTSFPLDRGSIEVNGIWKVRNGIINSDNHLLVIDPRIGTRIKNDNAKWLPLRLIMFFVRERSNVIDYDIPINGDLNKPKFNLRDVILDAVENTIIKPPTAPGRIRVKQIENQLENFLMLKWDRGVNTLQEHQKNFLEDLADLLKKDKNLTLNVDPYSYSDKEKECLLFFEAKKKYFLNDHGRNSRSLTAEDSASINKMSNKDSAFVKYLNSKTDANMLFTVQDKCIALLGSDFINAKLDKLLQSRRSLFESFFSDESIKHQIKIHKTQNKIPFNGFSYYKIEYKGDIPDSFLRVYRLMQELDSQPPRDKYKEGHKKAREPK